MQNRNGEEVLYTHKARKEGRTHTFYLWGIITQTNQSNYTVKLYDLIGDDTQEVSHYNKGKFMSEVHIRESEGYCHQKEGKLYFG